MKSRSGFFMKASTWPDGKAARIGIIESRVVDHRVDDDAVLLDERG